MKPAISIIVPVYNIEAYLEKCLDSILAQTFSNFEVIVVNDGSTDGSGQICNMYALKDKRVRIIHKAYGGVSSARNVGLHAAEGDYIGFVDGDDYIDVKMYQTLYHHVQRSKSDIAICKLGREINNSLVNRTADDDFYIKEFDHSEAMRELFKGILYRFSLCNKLFKRKCFNGILFPENRIHEDLSTTYLLFGNANKAVYINYLGYIYVKQQNSILTANYYKKRLDALIGWEEILPFMKINYPHLIEVVNTCFSYNCVDHAYSILSQVKDKKIQRSYLSHIQLCIRKHYKEIRKNATLSFTYLLIITMLRINIRLFILSNSFKKKLA